MKKLLAALVLLFAVNVNATPSIGPGAPVQIGSDWYLPIEVSGVAGDSLHSISLVSTGPPNFYVVGPEWNVEMTGSLAPVFTSCLCGDWLPGNYWDASNMAGAISSETPGVNNGKYEFSVSGYNSNYGCGATPSSGTLVYIKLVGEGSFRFTGSGIKWVTCDNVAQHSFNVNTAWVQVPPQGTGGGGGGGQWEEPVTVTQESAQQPKAKLPTTWGRIKALWR